MQVPSCCFSSCFKNPCCCYTDHARQELIIAVVPDTFKGKNGSKFHASTQGGPSHNYLYVYVYAYAFVRLCMHLYVYVQAYGMCTSKRKGACIGPCISTGIGSYICILSALASVPIHVHVEVLYVFFVGADLCLSPCLSFCHSFFRSFSLSHSVYVCMYVCMYVCIHMRLHTCTRSCRYVYVLNSLYWGFPK